MVLSVRVKRGVFAAALGSGAIAGGVLLVSPAAVADPPNCTAADLSQTASGVASATAGYLFAHPDVNAFFSGLRGQPRDAIRNQVRDYLNAHPQTRDDLHGIRQPLIDMRNRCGPLFAGGPGGSGTPPPPAGAPAPPPGT
ncbi:MAG: heme-binding protein [Mycobacteriaceae bacterium]|nr:heme-binding protein [Mycobacteriaceae bacterium]